MASWLRKKKGDHFQTVSCEPDCLCIFIRVSCCSLLFPQQDCCSCYPCSGHHRAVQVISVKLFVWHLDSEAVVDVLVLYYPAIVVVIRILDALQVFLEVEHVLQLVCLVRRKLEACSAISALVPVSVSPVAAGGCGKGHLDVAAEFCDLLLRRVMNREALRFAFLPALCAGATDNDSCYCKKQVCRPRDNC